MILSALLFFFLTYGVGLHWGWALLIVIVVDILFSAPDPASVPPPSSERGQLGDPDGTPTRSRWRGRNGPGFRGLGER